MRKLLWIFSVLFLLLGSCQAAWVYKGYRKGQIEYDSLKETITIPYTEDQAEEQKHKSMDAKTNLSLPDAAPDVHQIDFAKLKEISSDVCAWIEIPGIDVAYPVLQSSDNEYYLHRDIYGQYLFAGSIFLDCHNDPLLRNMNTIIYGHNMNDRSMFGKLREFRDQEFYNKDPYFWICNEKGSFLYKIFSVHLSMAGSSTFTVRFSDAINFQNWLMKMKEASEIQCDINPNITDQCITLSTCTGVNTERLVVQALLVAETDGTNVLRVR